MLLKFCALVVLFGFAIGKKCPDRTECQKGSTCCQLKGEKYTCCPLPNAVCCPDKEHCCPQGYSCDNETDACKPSASSTHPLLEAFASSRTKGNYVTCGTGEYLCPDGFTCCKSGDVKYNCCPLPNAVCCPDKQHCCPQGYSCDNETDSCKPSASFTHPLLETFTNSQTKGNNSICSEGEYICNDGFICCELGGGYTCCPYIIANCCPTGCCPSRTSSQNATAKPRARTSLLKPAHQLGDKAAGSPICPDGAPNGKFQCPDGYTCCPGTVDLPPLPSHCCPLENAVCCDDHIHCCPEGYVCNEGKRECDSKVVGLVPWSLKVKAIPIL